MEGDDLDIDDLLLTRKALANRVKRRLQKVPERNGVNHDEADAGANRNVGEITPQRASICDYFFAFASVATFVADIVFDVLVTQQHFANGNYEWFGLTLAFTILPSLVMQIFSYKWFSDDYLTQKWWTYLLHFFQLGTIQRYFIAFRYGLKTRGQDKVNPADYTRFLKEWRDITLLRLFEGFLEAAPQTILQLYILSSQSEFIIDRDWLTATSAVVSVISLSWSIVSYSQMLRLCLSDKGLSICGYMFQIVYRLFMVSSRVVVLVLFASVYKEYVFIFIFVHCCVMFAWINIQETVNSLENDASDELFLDWIFSGIVSVIYLYCFMTIQGKTTRKVISIFYTVMFIETAVLMTAWFLKRTLHGTLMFAAFGLVFGGFFLGILCMMMYYKFFHPNRDVTEGWFTCLCLGRKREPERKESVILKTSFSYSREDKDLVIINIKDKQYMKLEGASGDNSSMMQKRLSKKSPFEDIELPRPSSPLKNWKQREHCREGGPDHQLTCDVFVPSNIGHNNTNRQGLARYGACESPEKPRASPSNQAVSGENLDKVSQIEHIIIGNKRRARLENDENSKKENQKQNCYLQISVSKTKDLRQWDNNDDVLRNKTELGDIKLKNVKFSGSDVDKNGNKRELNEKKPLISRQGSKDDSHINNRTTKSSRSRTRSLQEHDSIRQNIFAWVKDQINDREEHFSLKNQDSTLANDDSAVLSTLV